jgi:ABC-type glycerol-3-phosphate transport system substrate-binding protein
MEMKRFIWLTLTMVLALSGIVVKTYDDHGGLKIALSPGVAVATSVEKYNETHPDNKIDVVWDTGAVDALFGERLNDKALLEAYGEDAFDVTGDRECA